MNARKASVYVIVWSLGWLSLAVVMTICGGCGSSVPAMTQRLELPDWCFGAVVNRSGFTRTAIGCFSTSGFCESALETVRQYGSSVGVERASVCSKRSP